VVQLASPDNGNRYAYAAADPVNQIDPTGMAPEQTDFEYILSDAANGAGAGAALGAGIGCLATIEAGCVEGAGVGAAIGGLLGVAAGAGYATGRVIREHHWLGT
jgi:hypothetical protein